MEVKGNQNNMEKNSDTSRMSFPCMGPPSELGRPKTSNSLNLSSPRNLRFFEIYPQKPQCLKPQLSSKSDLQSQKYSPHPHLEL